MVSEYDLMRLSDEADSEGFTHEDVKEMIDKDGKAKVGNTVRKVTPKKPTDKAKYLQDKQKYFDYYDDIKLTPKDDW